VIVAPPAAAAAPSTLPTAVPSDIEIAQRATLRPIADVAAELGVAEDELELYGRYKAKVTLRALERRAAKGRLVLVTGISPTAAGEGKSTVTVGVAQALRRMGKNVMVCLREPSLGPVFGVKGGAAGGGYAQVLPMEDINLHFTGDFHAITSAHNLLSALLDAHLHHGNGLGIDPRRIMWPRTIDMNDRALRSVVVGLGGMAGGPPREERFVIIPGSEIMAILALASSRADLEARLARIIVGLRRDKSPVHASELKAQGAMTLLLKDAINPNLVQTLEGGPALVHCGPFGNIAHGCNSVVATRLGLTLSDLVLTEAGFGADLGAEKFFDIKCRMAGLKPEAAIIVATVRALKMHGGVPKDQLGPADADAVQRGAENLRRHIRNVRRFGVPALVALNRFVADTEAEVEAVRAVCEAEGVQMVRCDVWEKGGEGGIAAAEALLDILARPIEGGGFRPLYDERRPIREKIETIARELYGAADVAFAAPAQRALELLPRLGLGETPVCMAKTQYSFSDDPSRMGAPSGFTLHVRDILPSAGAGFVVALAGDIMTMPGLGKNPAAERMRLHPDGTIEGLF
jgi:formate--tetrahydrofolate ligase